MSKAADLNPKRPPPRQFIMPPDAWSDRWEGRPTKPIPVGMRRISAEDRLRCHVEAIKRADNLMPEHRRSPDDLQWQKVYEITLIHYILGLALCNSVDVDMPLWPAQDGSIMLYDNPKAGPGSAPILSERFSDLGIERCLDELDILARTDPVLGRRASDQDLRRIGQALADGSFFARLKAVDNEDTRAVAAHLRMLFGGALELMERGREAPFSVGG